MAVGRRPVILRRWQAGEKAVEGNQCALTIRLLAAPTYVIVANSIDKDEGLKVSGLCVDLMSHGGSATFPTPPPPPISVK